MSYEDLKHLDTQHELAVCKRTLETLELRVEELERALEQLSRDYAELALIAASPRNGVLP